MSSLRPARTRWFVFTSLLASALALPGPIAAQDAGAPHASTEAAAPWFVLPFAGIYTFLGEPGPDRGAGPRLGVIAGARLTDLLSLGLELSGDLVNPRGLPADSASGAWQLTAAVAPLAHVPLGPLELVVGPRLGVWYARSRAEVGSTLVLSEEGRGFLGGANLGALTRVGPIALGLMVSFDIRSAARECRRQAVGPTVCLEADRQREPDKTLGVQLAARL